MKYFSTIKQLTKSLSWLVLLLNLNSSFASSDFLPANLLQLDPFFTHHILVVEKATHKLYLYENVEGIPKLIKSYQVATGKKIGNKSFQGDLKTPEGVYSFTDFLDHTKLIDKHGDNGEIYGVGAFVLNYPNPLDIRAGKTGGGIWLHSTNDETRIDKGLDSRGCIVSHNSQLIELSHYFELNKTVVVVTHELNFLEKETWTIKRNEIKGFMKSWLASWTNEDLNKYIDHYHPTDFFSTSLNSRRALKSYKRAVFNNPGKPDVKLENVSITLSKDYAVVTLGQVYKSNTIEDIGKKTLYLKRDSSYKWKIVTEIWSKLGTQIDYTTAFFNPSLRFFKSVSPESVLGHEMGKKHLKQN